MATSACYLSVVFLSLYLASSTVAADYTIGAVPSLNPAEDFADVVNANRTAHKLSTLYVNPRLGCIARQYIKSYEGDCYAAGVTDEEPPSELAIAVNFAPKCGVDSSTLAPITGWFLGCQANYADASEAFSEIFVTNKDSLDILHSESHTQVGVGVWPTQGGTAYLWCVLFTNGKPHSTFAFDHAPLMKLMMKIMVFIIVTDLAIRCFLRPL